MDLGDRDTLCWWKASMAASESFVVAVFGISDVGT